MRVRNAFGPLTLFHGGEPYTFRTANSAVLHVGGLVLAQPHRRVVLLNEAKLTPQSADVGEAVDRSIQLEAILRGTPGVTNFPSALEAYREARVVPFLSGASFEPRVLDVAIAAGVVPVVCSGARFHIAPHAPDPRTALELAEARWTRTRE